MKLSEKEKAAQKAAFQNMNRKEKLDHVFTYYKWYIILGIVVLIILVSVIYRNVTKKDPLVYLALTNVAIGEDMEASLTGGYIKAGGEDRKGAVYLYKDLYISENADIINHEYAYASRMKLMGSVNAGRLDLVLMNREAYDMLSRSGYLLELAPLLSGEAELYQSLVPYFCENEVVLSDNSIEYQLGEAKEHEVDTKTVMNGVDVSRLPLFEKAGFADPVYFGIIANSGRLPECVRYLRYLADGDAGAA